MRTIKNIATGEEIKISAIKAVNENGQLITDYIVGTRFFNKYGHMMHEVSRNEEENYQTMELKDGFEVVDMKRTRTPKKEAEPQYEEWAKEEDEE